MIIYWAIMNQRDPAPKHSPMSLIRYNPVFSRFRPLEAEWAFIPL